MRTLDDLLDDGDEGVQGRTVLVRSDLNVPLDDDRNITDDGRIRASAPTISALSGAGAQVVVTAHLGRPKNGPEERFSLAPVAERLGDLLGAPVRLVELGKPLPNMAAGDVVMLENIRFDARETSKDDAERGAFADELVALVGDDAAFVSDGFGVVHRKQASVYDVAQRLEPFAGGLVLSEVEVLRTLTGQPDRPYAVVLGGSKVSDKLAVIEALLPKVDSLLVGGGMCFTFLAAQGHGVGSSLLESEQIDTCRTLLESGKIVLPTDVVVADAFSADANTRTVGVGEIEDGWLGLDIGPDSVRDFGSRIAAAKTIFWNGPMGVFEMAPFAEGTRGVAQAVADSGAFSVVGGGDSAAAVRALGIGEDGFSHISTGGGASLEFLEGATLPGVAVLEEGA
ncbi:phosphoglycerate kinase [Pseudonocardia ammonioxydans]|uniref:Phosphoglycerate kinase n=1 Tax=Pseudonocardia ammonioxydans TaxID=260086 RepID=A0A1I5A794_PSUAM|nr:phosphoglycerate kinase [Pseudonocardia ammonioxydans]SFN58268.1 phosphoglycerate kinase [Pseudonocardia ammonioxydans]